jgi:hypothetical protein
MINCINLPVMLLRVTSKVILCWSAVLYESINSNLYGEEQLKLKRSKALEV